MNVDKITLVAPANWQSDLLSDLSDKNVVSVYGRIENDFIGTGIILPDLGSKVSSGQIVKYIREAHKNNISFAYIIDSICMNNLEWTRKGQARIRNILDSLVSFGVDSVALGMPYLAELIKKQYPSMRIEISSTAGVDSVQRAKRWEDLGADTITLVSYKVNRNFALLKNIRNNVKCALQLVANQACINNCISYAFCVNLISHMAQGWSIDQGNICRNFDGSGQSSRKKTEIISSAWIRPEDVSHYEEAGVNKLQLLSIGMENSDVLKIVNAYNMRYFKGNLAELFSGFPLMRGVFVNNAGLSDFINYFVEEKCCGICRECTYCADIANKVVDIGFGSNNAVP